MSFLKDNKVYIFLIYINILFLITLAKICYKIENFDYKFVTLLIIGGVISYWLFNGILRKTILKVVFTLLLLLGGTLYYFSNMNYLDQLIKIHIVNNFNLINSLVAKVEPTAFESYKPILIMVLPLLIFIIMFFTSKGAVNTILIVDMILIITLWYLGYTEEIKSYLFQFVFISLMTYCINSFMKNIKRLTRKGVKVSIKSITMVLYIIVISLIVAGLTNMMPQSFNGRNTSQIQNRFYNKFVNSGENLEEKGKKFKYDLAFSGYGSSGSKLGGPISVNKLIAFRVKSDKTYYLRGNTKDYYDGYSWHQSEKKYTPREDSEDSMLVDTYSKAYVDVSREINIYPEELNSSTIFSPILSYNVSIQSNIIYFDEASTFISGGIIDKPYSVYFYVLNDRGNARLILGSAQAFSEVGADFYNEFYKKYLQVPDNISTRVYELVNSLTKDKKNNFQKVQAIREYLNKKYPYTLNVSVIPEGQEFLDYFLFTEQKGYCTYFATAETIMCRIAGIPARYVEGFNMTEEKDENGLYVVRNQDAHAWTEVLYLENPMMGMWYVVDAVPSAVDIIREEEEKAKEELENASPGIKAPNINPAQKSMEDVEEGSSANKERFIIPPALLKIIYIILVIVLINVVLILLFERRKFHMINSKSILPIYKYSLDRLSTIGYVQSEYIPDMELIDKMNMETAEKVKAAASLAYKEYFGCKEPSAFDKFEYYKFIEAEVRKKQSAIKYFVKKYYFSKKISFIIKKLVLLYKKIQSI